MAHTISARSEVDPRFTWAITDLFPSDDAWRQELARMRGMLKQVRGYEGRLGESAASREKERHAEILKNMDPAEQERVIREVLKEFLS